MSAAINYTPSSWQQKFHSLSTHEALGAGSAGPGKSLCLIMDPMEQVALEHNRCLDRKHPFHLDWGESTGWALHMRREFPMLVQTLDRCHKIFPKIDPDVRWDSQNHMFVFRSGYKYQFGHCRDSGDWQGYDSNQYTHLGMDELVQFEEEQYNQLKSRVRSSDPLLRDMCKVRAMSNPFAAREGSFNAHINNPHWVRDYFVKPEPKGGVVLVKKVTRKDGSTEDRTRIYLPATLYDNPDADFVRVYEGSLASLPAHIRAAKLYGDWWVSAGAHYASDWNPSLHICRPFKIPPDWKRFRSLDWGFKTHGTCLWWAIDFDGTMYCEREYSFIGVEARAVAKRIREIEEDAKLWVDGRSGISGYADTNLWEERGEHGKSKAQEMADAGISWLRADKKSRARNSERFIGRLRDHAGGTKNPGIVFFETAKKCLETIPGIQTDPHDPECPADGGDDHWHDAVLYACAAASRGRAGIASTRSEDKAIDDDIELQAERGQYGYGSSAL